MSGVFSVLSDAQNGMFRMQQAKKPWEKEIGAKDALGQLAEKASKAAQSFQLSPKQQSDRATAQAALEEARRIGGPKASAEQKLEQVERKIEDLKRMMRFAQGDPAKLAQLAREAALLAREAGRAAKEYAGGVAAAAEMGLPGGAGAIGTTEITRTTTVTTLTVQHTALSFSLQVTAAAGDRNEAVPAQEMMTLPAVALLAAPSLDAPADAGSLSGASGGGSDTSGSSDAKGDDLPPDLARLVDGALSGLRDSDGLIPGNRRSSAHAAMQSLMTDNDLKMSRYKEADAFGQRVEKVLRVAKRALSDAKIANEQEESEKRRKEKREEFKVDEKMIDAAQKEVNNLRQAAFGSSVTVASLLGGADKASGQEAADTGGVSDVLSGAVPAQTVPQADAGAGAVNLLA
jgi:hypothetical protein